MMFPISGCLDHANLAVSWRCAWQALTVLNGIDTSQHTFDQLHQMVGKDVVERAYLYRHLQKWLEVQAAYMETKGLSVRSLQSSSKDS